MRSVSHAVKTVIGGAGLVAVLFGALAAPASAAPSRPSTDLSGAVATPGKAVTDLPSVTSLNVEEPYVCFRGHVENIGWQSWDCDNTPDGAADAGVTGQSLRLEAVQIIAHETGGLTCAQAHVQDIGWQGEKPQCVEDGSVLEIGTVGKGLRVEAILFGSTVLRTCAEGHVQNLGWLGQNCQPAEYASIVGTEGQGLRLEAYRATVRQKA
jgi:uncharacterized protein YjdB